MSKKKIIQKEFLTPLEYGNMIGVTQQAVTKRIRTGKGLKGISDIQVIGRMYLLKVGNWDEIKK